MRKLAHHGSLPRDSSGQARDHLQTRRLRRLMGTMAQNDVGKFVSDHSREFSFAVDGGQQARLNEHRPSREGESIDGGIGDDFKRKWEPTGLRLVRVGDAHAHLVDIRLQESIVQHHLLFADLSRSFLAHLDILLLAESIQHSGL